MGIKWNKVLVYLDISVPTLVLLIGIISFLLIKRTKLSFGDLVLFLFLAMQVLLNGLGNYYQDHFVNNNWIYHLNCFLTISLFCLYFYKSAFHKKEKNTIIALYFLFFFFFFLNILFIQNLKVFNSYSYALGSFVLVLCVLSNFQRILSQLPTLNILGLKNFWINTGTLIYFGSCFFIFLSYRYLSIVSIKQVGILWKIHNVFLAVGCFVFLKAFLTRRWIVKSF